MSSRSSVPDVGDETRGWGPPFDPDGASAYFLSVNRNKLSHRRRPRLRTPISDSSASLASEADVVVENFLPGTLERHGLGRRRGAGGETRRSSGARSPDSAAASRRPGYDFVVQAECGWMSVTGEANGEPMKARHRAGRRHRWQGREQSPYSAPLLNREQSPTPLGVARSSPAHFPPAILPPPR